jgi:hypothetical protein
MQGSGLLSTGIVAAALVLATPALAAAPCAEERGRYDIARSVPVADVLIACLDMVLGSAPLLGDAGGVVTPTMGVGQPGNPEFMELQRRFEELKRQLGLSDSDWSALMTSSVSASDTVTVVINEEAVWPESRSVDVYSRPDSLTSFQRMMTDMNSVQFNYVPVGP